MKPRKPKCPSDFTTAFARQLLEWLGADVSQIADDDCWGSLARKFPELRPRVEEYFAAAAAARRGNPALAAYLMCRHCGSSREWAEGVIAAARRGNPAWAAYLMCRECGSSREWAEGVIEAVRCGGPELAAEAAYRMACYCGSSHGWADRVARHGRMRAAAARHTWRPRWAIRWEESASGSRPAPSPRTPT